VTNRIDFVILSGMSDHKEQQQPRRKSFSNGNAPDTTGLPLEGWVIQGPHWWLW
jgi:hypothetical protein